MKTKDKACAALLSHDAPCDKYACTARSRCAAERLACNALLIYVDTGIAHDPRRFAPPDPATFVVAEMDRAGTRAPTYKTLILDPGEAADAWREFDGALA